MSSSSEHFSVGLADFFGLRCIFGLGGSVSKDVQRDLRGLRGCRIWGFRV